MERKRLIRPTGKKNFSPKYEHPCRRRRRRRRHHHHHHHQHHDQHL